jgi:hypothetical protein
MKTVIAVAMPMFVLFVVLSCHSDACAQTTQTESTPGSRSILPGSGSAANSTTAPSPASSAKVIQAETANPGAPSATGALRTRTNFVRTVGFHLRTGELVFGKLVSEDKNKVTLEQLEESTVVVSTYSKREIEPRTMQTRSVPEYRYYLDLADYFSGRTWDFRDDPDDFIQAIRCCEKAKQSVQQVQTPDSEKIAEIDAKIKQLQADRQVWERETKTRAELRKLEYEAEVANKLKDLEAKVNAASQRVNDSVEQLDKAVTDIQENHRRLEAGLFGIQQQLNMLADRTEINRRLLDPWRWNYQPRFYNRYRPYYYGPGIQP